MDSEKKIRDIYSVMTVLIPSDKDVELQDSGLLVENVLDMKVKKMEEFLNSMEDLHWLRKEIEDKKISCQNFAGDDKRVLFVDVLLNLLLILIRNVDAAQVFKILSTDKVELPQPDLLSVQFLTLIRTAMQFVFGFGIIPYFFPGVGIPLERRTSSNALLKIRYDSKMSLNEKQQHLSFHMEKVFSTLENSDIFKILKKNFLSDTLAAFCQLSYAPLENETGTLDTKNIRRKPSFWKNILTTFILKFDLPLIVKELFVLQGMESRKDAQNISIPQWMKFSCRRLLTKILIEQNGVLNFFSGALDIPYNEDGLEIDAADWQKVDVIIQLIATCPAYMKSEEFYYSKIWPQIFNLVSRKQNIKSAKLTKIVCRFIEIMKTKNPDLTNKIVMNPLMLKLFLCSEDAVVKNISDIANLRNVNITHCIDDLHTIFVVCNDYGSSILYHLVPYLEILFHLFVFSRSSIYDLGTKIRELLTTALDYLEPEDNVTILMNFIFPGNRFPRMLSWNSNLQIDFNDIDGLTVHSKEASESSEDLVVSVNEIEAIIEIITCWKQDKTKSMFFMKLLERLPSILKPQEVNEDMVADDSSLLLRIETKMCKNMNSFRDALNLFELLSIFSEMDSFTDMLIHNLDFTLDFIKSTLERGSELCSASEDFAMNGETLNMAMSYLTLILSEPTCSDHIPKLQLVLPALLTLSEKHPDKNVKEMASELRFAILTHGVHKPNCNQEKAKAGDKNKSELRSTKNREKQEKDDDKFSDHKKCETSLKTDESKGSKFQEACSQVNDVLLPVQGHALLMFRKLLEARDPEALENKHKIFEIFKSSLSHEDSYIYLNAIQGLATVADVYHEFVVPYMTSELLKLSSNGDKSCEIRMKIGEALVKTTRNLGNITPKYREVLLNTFLSGCRDNDSLIRASSLSNLGEVCKNLRFSLGRHIFEIFNCVSALLQTDTSVEVRRAAVLVLNLLLEGLGQDSFQVLESVLKDLYRLLKRTLVQESDDIVKQHVWTGLETLENITREFLFPEQSLTKKIQILDFSVP